MAYFAAALMILCFNLFKFDYFVDDFKLLYPLIGEWAAPYKGGELIEKWELKYEKMMNGKTVFLKGDEEKSQEHINLVLEDRRIYYIPTVTGQNNDEPVKFTLIEIVDENKFIFENKDHDFPQRIIYDLKTPGVLVATIEGETKNGMKSINYTYKKKTESIED